MELSKKQLKEIREGYLKHNYNEEYRWGFLSALKSLGITKEQIAVITEIKY